MLPFPPDPLYTAEELAAYHAINELLAQVDAAFGVTGEPYFLGLAPVEQTYEGDRTDIELEAIAQMDEWKKRIDDIETYQPAEQVDVEPQMFSLFDAHDPLDFVA